MDLIFFCGNYEKINNETEKLRHSWKCDMQMYFNKRTE